MTSDDARRSLINIGILKRLMAGALGVVASFLRIWNRLTQRPNHDQINNVVLLEPFGMGDVISYEPLLRVLRRHGKHVTLCARSEWHPLFPDATWLDCHAAWGQHLPGEKYRFRAYFNPAFRKFLADLRSHCRGGIGIDTRGDIRNIILLYLAGCSRVISVSNYLGSNLRVPRIAATIVSAPQNLRRWELNLRCAEPLGIATSGTSAPEFPHLRATVPPLPSRVGIMVTAPWAGKFWPQERWAEVVTRLRTDGFEVVALCGPGQTALARQQAGVDLPILENDSIQQYAANLQSCSLVITLDSGPMHLADALGVPVVALFGVGSLPLWAPSNPRSCVVTHRTSPDFRVALASEENTELGRAAMNRITVADVLKAVENVQRKEPISPKK
jgi:ADP-heptose:LPS heptosyltransferase